jgi:hypothetical protein
MTQSLPANPSLENLKKQAKTLQKASRAGAAEAIARIRAGHPQYGGLSDEHLRAIQPRLTDCQLVLAREAGFASWLARDGGFEEIGTLLEGRGSARI